MWFVYLLRCRDGTYYTGVARDVERRLAEHNAGRGARYTRGRGPMKVVAASPARFASPEVDKPFRAASASMASHICLCENIRASTRTFCHKRC